MARMRVGLLGASGETGGSILNGLLEDGGFDIVAFSRPSSINRPANLALKDKGVELREMDLAKDSQDQLVAALKRIDVLLSAIGAPAQLDQIPLVTAAKTAGVKRFVPCGYIPVIPAGGVHLLRDQKEEVYNHMKRLGLPYTIIDCGWWYQVSTPRLPSGKIDNVIMMEPPIANKGEQPSALTDLRDVGRYVARVIKDDRTLNKQVLVYNEMWSQSQVWDKLEEVSGEKLTRNYVSQEQLEGKLADAKKVLESDPSSFMNLLHMIETQYLISWGCRGDNTPEYAKYLGYITSEELYPDFKYVKFEEYVNDLVAGKIDEFYVEMKEQLKAMLPMKP